MFIQSAVWRYILYSTLQSIKSVDIKILHLLLLINASHFSPVLRWVRWAERYQVKTTNNTCPPPPPPLPMRNSEMFAKLWPGPPPPTQEKTARSRALLGQPGLGWAGLGSINNLSRLETLHLTRYHWTGLFTLHWLAGQSPLTVSTSSSTSKTLFSNF